MASSKLRFTPPFCPNPDCKHHQDQEGWRFIRWGHYLRTCPRVHTVPRFRCSHCRRSFSRQTFQTTYWLRRPELFHTICERLLSGSGLRQIARFGTGRVQQKWRRQFEVYPADTIPHRETLDLAVCNHGRERFDVVQG